MTGAIDKGDVALQLERAVAATFLALWVVLLGRTKRAVARGARAFVALQWRNVIGWGGWESMG